MSKVNRGKQFEDCIEQAFLEIPDTSVDRLLDPQAGYAGVSNVCDFIVYRKPRQYYIECKSCYGNTLSIYSNDPKRKYGAISNKQWEGLLEKSKIDGVCAGYIIWFIDHDQTIYVPAPMMEALRNQGDKSFNITKWQYEDWEHIPGKKRRILFDYDMHKFLGI